MGSSASGSILVLDTSGSELAAALVRTGDSVRATLVHRSGGAPSERLRPLVLGLLEWENVPLSGLTGLAVVRGPGSFTGLRVGLSFGLGLATSLALPATGIGSLDALAAAARHELGDGTVAIFLSTGSRRLEWYAARYRVAPEILSSDGPVQILPAEESGRILEGADLVAGDLPLGFRKGIASIPRDRILDGAVRLAQTRLFPPESEREPLLPLYVVETVAVPPGSAPEGGR